MHHGQEINIFFFRYGYKGIIGACISSLLIGIIIFLSLKLIQRYNIKDYYSFFKKINNTDSKIKLNKIINIIINMFLLVSFYIMIAGFAAYIFQEFKISPIIGSILITFMCYITFGKNIEGIIKVNTILIPFLIICIMIFGIISKYNIDSHQSFNVYEKGNWLISAILHGSYNSILLIPILITLKKYVKNTKQCIIISASCVFIILLLTTSIYNILAKINIDISEIELPAIYAISYMGKGFKIIYGFIIISSIFTTAISSGYGFLNNCSKTDKIYKHLNYIICLSGLLISNIGFSKLVNFLYPVFGMLGLIQIFLIIKSNYKLTIEKKQ